MILYHLYLWFYFFFLIHESHQDSSSSMNICTKCPSNSCGIHHMAKCILTRKRYTHKWNHGHQCIAYNSLHSSGKTLHKFLEPGCRICSRLTARRSVKLDVKAQSRCSSSSQRFWTGWRSGLHAQNSALPQQPGKTLSFQTLSCWDRE